MIFLYDHVSIDPDKQIGMHSQRTWELSYIIKGSGNRIIGGSVEPFSPGDLVLVPEGMSHQWNFIRDGSEVKNISVFFDREILETLAAVFPSMSTSILSISEMSHYVVYSGGNAEEIISVLLKMDEASDERRAALFVELIPLLRSDKGKEDEKSSPRVDLETFRLNRIKTYIRCNYARKISLEELAGYVAMSRTALCVFYKNRTGSTIGEAVISERIGKACELLKETNMPVEAIAAATGFSDSSHFIRTFRKKMACTPSGWRNCM